MRLCCMTQGFYLGSGALRRAAHQAIDIAPDGYYVTLRERKRSEEQSDTFHGICTSISKSGKEFAGEPRGKDEWKILLISGHGVVTGRGSDVVAGIEGELVNLRESSARMSKSRMSSLIDYSLAYVSNEGIEVYERAPW